MSFAVEDPSTTSRMRNKWSVGNPRLDAIIPNRPLVDTGPFFKPRDSDQDASSMVPQLPGDDVRNISCVPVPISSTLQHWLTIWDDIVPLSRPINYCTNLPPRWDLHAYPEVDVESVRQQLAASRRQSVAEGSVALANKKAKPSPEEVALAENIQTLQSAILQGTPLKRRRVKTKPNTTTNQNPTNKTTIQTTTGKDTTSSPPRRRRRSVRKAAVKATDSLLSTSVKKGSSEQTRKKASPPRSKRRKAVVKKRSKQRVTAKKKDKKKQFAEDQKEKAQVHALASLITKK